jgi:hypothetical protein
MKWPWISRSAHNEVITAYKSTIEAVKFELIRTVAERDQTAAHYQELVLQLIAMRKEGYTAKPQEIDYPEPELDQDIMIALDSRLTRGSFAYHQLFTWCLEQVRLGKGTADIVTAILEGQGRV